MMRMALSSAASALMRALIQRAGVARDRILLMDWRSVDWQSLTFIGERHEIAMRICGPDAADVCQRLVTGLSDAEFTLPGHVLADIAAVGEPRPSPDGSLELNIEALTIAD